MKRVLSIIRKRVSLFLRKFKLYKDFDDLVFTNNELLNGPCAKMYFKNGYGVSVVRFKLGGLSGVTGVLGDVYGSRTSDDNEWELAVLKLGNEGWEIDYD